jgi:hypothetical protein
VVDLNRRSQLMSQSYHAHESVSRADKTKSRTRASTWVPRRVYYVLCYLRRALSPGSPKAISNKRIQEAIRFGSEGEVSQIMRWLSGEAPTAGRWAYGALNQEQLYSYIDRERMPNGGYLITLLATPRPIVPPPSIVQLALWDDPSVIPCGAQPKAPEGGSFLHDPPERPDPPHSIAPERRSQRDQHEEIHEESNKQQHGARPKKSDWSGTTIDGLNFLPIAALEAAGHTPESVRAADAKIQTRREYDRPAQVRILIRSLLTRQPIYSAAEMQARSEEQSHERPARSAAPSGARRRSAKNRRERAAESATDPEYAAYLAECLAAPKYTPADFPGLPVPGQRRAAYGG